MTEDARCVRSRSLRSVGRGARPGTVYLVGAGPGDPDLLTLRGLELLESADFVLHDELVAPSLLRRARKDAIIEYVGKRGDRPTEKQQRQSEIDARLVELAGLGRSVVRLKGGDPFLFGRGSEEAETLVRAGIPFEVVPGVTSPIAAAAYAGISLTHRDFASSVLFLSGTTRHGEAFDFNEIQGHRGTVCILMGLRRLDAIATALVRDAGREPSTPAAVISAGTRADQRVVTGTLANIAERVAEAQLPTPALVVVGNVVRLRDELRWFDDTPLFGKRVMVTRAEHQASCTIDLLRRRGAIPIEAPLIAIEDVEDVERITAAAAKLEGYDCVAFTSTNAVDRFFAVLGALGRDARAFGRSRIACVGSGTAAALTRCGLVADIVPTTYRGEALADAILRDLETTRGEAAGARVLLPRAEVAREVLPERLRERGIQVDVVPVYRTVRPDADHLASIVRRFADRTVDVVLLTSGSAAEALCDLLGAELPRLTRDVVIASISDVTTSAAKARGARVDVTATRSTIEDLIDAVEQHFAASADGAERG
ncbi:MAG: uroporphyrinogen-III C-methyltransferase [Polyangiaceae bacterium]|nr:uroporphyrinogen-III C-methyltransferase [Polyangiaceae bacterium]